MFCWVLIGADGQPTDPVLKDQMAGASMIRLARAKILECKLYSDISIAERRNARPSPQPYIACGVADNVKWAISAHPPLTSGEVTFARSLGSFLTADIDTKSAGFRTTPCYFVEIRGKSPQVLGGSTFIVDGVATVTSSDVSKFSIEVDVLVQRLAGNDGVTIDAAAFSQWQVTWMGVEG